MPKPELRPKHSLRGYGPRNNVPTPTINTVQVVFFPGGPPTRPPKTVVQAIVYRGEVGTGSSAELGRYANDQ